MPKYYGCPCEGCGKPLTLRDDIVVCPDCGAPYHRDCYEKLGRCIHSAAHAAGYEWKFPYQESELCTCPACGERTLRSEEHCRCCGAVLPPEGAEEPADRSEDPGEGSFDYSSFYRQFQETGTPSADPMKQAYEAAFGKEEAMDGIPCADWASYIGPASPAYMNTYCRMQLAHSKVSMSFSALLFGPFYFFYRKAWKPAFGFLAAELLLAVPTLLQLMQITGSTCRLSVPVRFEARRCLRRPVAAVTAVELQDPPEGPQPSLILRRMAEGETLWDIARQYRTDEEAIRAANELTEDRPEGMLLIPRVR